MSPDGDRPDVPWQRSDNTNWDQSLEHARQVDYDASPPLPASGNEEVFDSDQPVAQQEMDDWGDEGNQTGAFEAAAGPFDFLKEPSRYVPIIVVPLVFAVLSGLIVFLALSLHRAYISPIGFLPTVILIIAFAVAQGAVISYMDVDNGMWILATVGGFSLFLLLTLFALFGPLPAFIVFCVLVVLFVVIVRFYFHTVAEGYIDIVYAFGQYRRTLAAGPNLLLPWEKIIHTFNIGEKQWVCPLQKVQLSRDDDAVLRATISYQLLPNDANITVKYANQWEEMLKELIVSTIQNVATTFTPDDFIVWPQGLHSRPLTYDNAGEGELRWERVNKYLYDLIAEHASNWGVMVNWVRIRDVSLAPHGATIVETDAVFDMPTTIIENPAPPAAAAKNPPPKAQAKPPGAQKGSAGAGNAKLAEETTQAVPVPSQPAQDTTPAAPPLPNEKVLIEAYNAVKNGKITDPRTIRGIAAKFDLIAHDSKSRETVSFDAERAAQILYGWAQKNDPLFEVDYDDETKPDWVARPPNDENLMAGG